MGNLEVVLADLSNMAGTFRHEADDYRAITPKITPPLADSGDGALNGVMKGVMELIAVLHQQMAATIGQHGDKLDHAQQAYSNREIDNRFLYDDLMKE